MSTDSLQWSYRPGPWYAVLGDAITIALPVPDHALVAEVWRRVEGGATVEDVLDGLLADGLARCPSFALVERSEDLTRVVVRGEGLAVRAAGDTDEVRIEGPDDAIWAERRLSGVTSLTVDLPARGRAAEPDADREYAVRTGLVRVSRVEAHPTTPITAERGTGGGAHLAAVPDAPAVAVSSAAAAADAVPTGAVPVDTAPADPAPAPMLRSSDGQSVAIDRVVLIGRAPRPRDDAEEATLLSVPSRLQEISSTHAEVRPGGAGEAVAMLTDMGSTNGTVLTAPGEEPRDLRPGIAVPLVVGAVIDLGDGVSVEVLGPGGS
ncbi:FHA domain-containing protein [Nocardioides panacisoli]|uniref:FHA domain-containing protein n=1 Tax=Nocardioides panacisoli TaxID=627624 RepID=UPI001C633679|nr:FHA domain-containing protein [Nocardioides panacisoli]QYJ02672.1 FHA domain-containing protein [Nocardioides panacisoli]